MRATGTHEFCFDRPGIERAEEGSRLFALHCRAVSNLRVVDAALDVWLLLRGFRKPRRIWMADYEIRRHRARLAAVMADRKRFAEAG